MIRYNIAAVVRASGRKRVGVQIMPPIVDRPGTVRSYLAAERAMLAEIAAEVRRSVLAQYQAEREFRRMTDGSTSMILIKDVDESTFARLRAIAADLASVASRTINDILGLEAIRHTETFRDQARKVLGIDLSAVVTAEDLQTYLEMAAARNTGLIKSLADDVVKRVEQTILNAGIRGDPTQEIRKLLTGQFGVVDSRARLIARDQTAKFTSDLNRIRQQQAGIDSYKWSTSHDERVRPLHREIDGTEYEWGEATDAEQGLPPGQPIQCRCVARAIVRFDMDKKKAPEPVETIEARNDRLDQDAKTYVVEQGKKTETEYLDAYDSVSGERFARTTSNQKGFVAFTPEINAAIRNPSRKVVLHHNHPSSSSFSTQDYKMLFENPGMTTMYAHGHNGSSFRAERGVGVPSIDGIENQVRSRIQKWVTAYEIPPAEAGKIHMHVVSLIMQKKGFIRYVASLDGETLTIWNKYADRIKREFEL